MNLTQSVLLSKRDIPPDLLECFEPAECGECYICHMVAVFREVRQVLKDDGTLWLNIGDSYAANGTSGLNVTRRSSTFHGGNSDARQREKTVPPGLKPKDLVGIPWRVGFALQADGWWLRSDIIWSKPNPMPESVTDRPTKSHEYLFLLAKSERYFYDADAIKEPAIYSGPNAPDAIKSLYGQGFTRRAIDARIGTERPRDYEAAAARFGDGVSASRTKAGGAFGNGYSRNCRTVWTIATQPYSGAHFATFPEKLVETCLLAGSRPGDLVFDPFVGSGTVIRVATRLQRRGVGCDLNFEYLSKQARKRASKVQVEMQYDRSDPAGDPALPSEAG